MPKWLRKVLRFMFEHREEIVSGAKRIKDAKKKGGSK